eukprot:TRINITY_DN66616_c9_g2_i1.p1 TRINITY_DN66616_c9_g2~~TRINITY_DN66616_c9_g2_i1.p1  ORF type:complete len:479 (+),score=273.31 TRINITY_DN66616_c9_g2_i1:95-1531(+)
MSARGEEALVGLVERATQELLKEPDWSLNTQIIDALAANPRHGKAVVKVIGKRIAHKNPEVGILAATLIDGIVKNVPAVHRYVASKDFMNVLYKLVKGERTSLFRRRLDDSDVMVMELKERVLVLIQTWGIAFASSDSLILFTRTYNKLMSEGVRFPQPDKDEMAPVFTPPKHVPKQQPPKALMNISDAYTDSECVQFNNSVKLLVETVTETKNKKELNASWVRQLAEAIRRAQPHLMGRIQNAAQLEPTTLDDVLRLNDVMVNALAYYDGVRADKMERLPAKDARSKKKTKANNDRAQEEGNGASSDAQPSPSSGEETKKKKKKKKTKAAAKVPVLGPPPSDTGGGGEKKSKKKNNNVPLLAPPPEEGSSGKSGKKKKKPKKRRSSSKSASVNNGGDADDLLDLFAAPAPTAATSSSATAAAPPAANAADEDSDDDDDDDFFALATRSDDAGKKDDKDKDKQQASSTPADALDIFFS